MNDNFPLLFLPLFVAGWIGVMHIISSIGGWRELAKVYPAGHPPSGQIFRFSSARLRYGTAYNSVLTYQATPQGLHLSVLLPFRFGHQPIFVPWNEISATRLRKKPFWHVRLQFTGCPSVPLDMSARLAEKLERASGFQFKPEPSEQ